jgi:hypothetical protein
MNKVKNKLIDITFGIVTIAILGGCIYLMLPGFNRTTNTNSNTESSYEDYDSELSHPDGTFSAEVDYYNSNTGTSSTYTLDVEVENNEVTVIYWPNGGELDDSHFTPQELDGNGSCSFTSDEGYDYEVTITDPEYFKSSSDDYESNPAEDHEQ